MSSRIIINILVLVAMLFVATTSVALACDPRYGYCPPPTYSPPVYVNPTNSLGVELSYGWSRGVYDTGYAVQQAQHAYYQAAPIGRTMWEGVKTYPYSAYR